MENEVDTFLDLLMLHPKTRIGTATTFARWDAEGRCFEGWQEGVLAWSIEFGDRDPFDVERDVAIKLWQILGG